MERDYYHEYAALEDSDWWFRGRRRIIRHVLRKHFPPAARNILDVGCGTGAMLELLREFGCVEGLDNSPEALAYSRQRLGSAVPLHHGSLPDDLPELPQFDLVTAFDVLEHIAAPVDALAAIRGLLKPGGAFVCTVPACQFLWGPHDEINHHFRRYSAKMLLTQLEQAGFDVCWHSYFNSVLFAPIAAVRLVGRLFPAREPKSDLQRTPRLLAGILERSFASERFWLGRGRLPIGVSLMAIAVPRVAAAPQHIPAPHVERPARLHVETRATAAASRR